MIAVGGRGGPMDTYIDDTTQKPPNTLTSNSRPDCSRHVRGGGGGVCAHRVALLLRHAAHPQRGGEPAASSARLPRAQPRQLPQAARLWAMCYP
eukprot:jgi/Mesvir1/26043/Mv26553-RA.2